MHVNPTLAVETGAKGTFRRFYWWQPRHLLLDDVQRLNAVCHRYTYPGVYVPLLDNSLACWVELELWGRNRRYLAWVEDWISMAPD
jgi:hypothetical protein